MRGTVPRSGAGSAHARWRWIAGIGLGLLALAYAVAFLTDEPLRRLTERQMNAQLEGYTARIGELDWHPLGFAVDFRDVLLTQDAHPDPPVLRVRELTASVQWKALIRARVVADFEIEEPAFHIDRTHFVRENEDPVPVQDRGWQDALQEMYPLKINALTIDGGSLTYIDSDRSRPLRLSSIEVIARNLRNVQSEADAYPSPVQVRATVFEEGRLAIDGDADFLASPHAAVKAHVTLDEIALEYFHPILARYGFALTGGIFGGSGEIEYAPEVKVVDLDQVRVSGLRAEYTHDGRSAAPVKQAAATTAEAAQEVSNRPGVLLRAKEISLDDFTLGFANAQTTPHYRVFLESTNLVVENFSNQRTEGTATARLRGRFMGRGPASLNATFRAETQGPDFDVDVRIEDTDLRALNDLLRAHADVDVVSGVFSLYSEARVQNDRIEGYVKPLFRDLEISDPRQDRDESLGDRLKEKAAELVGSVLRNDPHEEVATVIPLEGPVSDPEAGTWQALLGLLQNGFFKAILPGFEREHTRAPEG